MVAGRGTVTINILGKADSLKNALGQADKDLGGFAGKVDGVGKSMMGFGSRMTLGVTGPIVAGLGLATKAAAEDEAAQASLAHTLRNNVVAATDETVAAVERQIEKFMKVSTFSDDELRPAFGNLVRATKDVSEANALLGTAMDIATARGIPLETVTLAMAKAHDGNVGALGRLGIQTKDAEGKTLSFEEVMKNANATFGGAAAAALETSAGKAAQLKVRMGEMTEQIGSALVPILDKVIPIITSLAEKFEGMSPTMQTTILVVAGVAAAIGPLVTVVGALAVAFAFLAANPIVLVIAALVALGVAIWRNWETIQTAVSNIKGWVIERWDEVVGFLGGLPGRIRGAVAGMWDGIKDSFRAALNWIIDRWNGLEFSIGGQEVFGIRMPGVTIGTPNLPRFHQGGVVPGAPGSEMLGLLRAGERVIPNGGVAAGPIVIQLVVDGKVLTEVVHNGFLEKQRRSGALGLV